MSSSLCLQMLEKWLISASPELPLVYWSHWKVRWIQPILKKKKRDYKRWMNKMWFSAILIRGASYPCYNQTSSFTRAECGFLIMFSKWLIWWVIHTLVINQHISFVSIYFWLKPTQIFISYTRLHCLYFFWSSLEESLSFMPSLCLDCERRAGLCSCHPAPGLVNILHGWKREQTPGYLPKGTSSPRLTCGTESSC